MLTIDADRLRLTWWIYSSIGSTGSDQFGKSRHRSLGKKMVQLTSTSLVFFSSRCTSAAAAVVSPSSDTTDTPTRQWCSGPRGRNAVSWKSAREAMPSWSSAVVGLSCRMSLRLWANQKMVVYSSLFISCGGTHRGIPLDNSSLNGCFLSVSILWTKKVTSIVTRVKIHNKDETTDKRWCYTCFETNFTFLSLKLGTHVF